MAPLLRMDPRLAWRIAEKRVALDARHPLPPATLRLLHEDLQSLATRIWPSQYELGRSTANQTICSERSTDHEPASGVHS